MPMGSRNLEILERADTTDLVVLSTLKTRLGISGSGEDTTLGELIDEVTADFGRITRRREFARQQYRETIIGDGKDLMTLSRAPIEQDSVTLTIDGESDTDFEIEDHEAGILYREDGWTASVDIVVTYRAGWLVPGVVGAWEASTGFGGAGETLWVRPSKPSLSPLVFEATTAGSSDVSEPTWPTTVGGTVTDGTVVWTGRAVEELPKSLSGLAIAGVQELREGAPRSVASERTGADSVSFNSNGDFYSAALVRALQRYRL